MTRRDEGRNGDQRKAGPASSVSPPQPEERRQNMLPLSRRGALVGAIFAVAVVVLATAVVWWRGDGRALLFGFGLLVLMPPVGALLGAILGGVKRSR